MKSKQQIIPVGVSASCETYGCYKKATWAIGRPDAPRALWSYYCSQCMKDIVSNIPAELLPDPEKESDAEKFFCQYCGRECKNVLGLQSHERACATKEDR
jgi:DNA-directed RNA polymerase subunit RPC12/RpoP